MKKLALTAIMAALTLTGCAYMHSTTQSYSADGKLTGKTSATAYALFDANAALTKFRNQSATSGTTNNTFAPGTYMAGLSESASTGGVSNLAPIFEAVAEGIVKGLKP